MDVQGVIREEIHEFLNETAAVDIWSRFYEKLPKEVFYKIIEADPTTNLDKDKMGKFSKWLIGLYKKNKLKYKPHYGFDSSPDRHTFNEYFNEEF